ncbi:uncharacterized protein LOC112639210 [Camponotus floridanus]|uniref:uncharacterized protein LOC112639210 n=1 Tax=Camponotus floridanus TaxID=104421 RepID=UPI000DC6BEF2|nr:uncharacterized protein LOC112639210 [Camponotus floridanus]
MQSGQVLESWPALRQALIQMFDRRISFTAPMQRIEARKWNSSNESFDQYVIDKLSLIHRLNIPTTDAVNLIIGGIQQHSLRATALTLPTHSVDQLEAMRRITFGMSDIDKKNQHPSKGDAIGTVSRQPTAKQQGTMVSRRRVRATTAKRRAIGKRIARL